MKVYEILSLDVYGNNKEGYEINDLHSIGFYIESKEFPSFDNIVKILKKEGYLKKRFKFSSQYPYDEFEIVEYQGMPLYQIQEYDTNWHGQEYKNSSWFTKFPIKRNSIVYRICPKMIRKIQ